MIDYIIIVVQDLLLLLFLSRLVIDVSRYAESGIRGQCLDWWNRVKRNPTLLSIFRPVKQSSNNVNIINQNSKTTVSRLTYISSLYNMATQGEDDLQASTTEGFKVGEKKTVEEYAKLGECMKLRFSTTHTFSSARTPALKHCSPQCRR